MGYIIYREWSSALDIYGQIAEIERINLREPDETAADVQKR